MLPVLIKVLIGAALGGTVGYFGKCSSGTCPLTSSWWRGAIYGGVLGLLFAFLSPGGGGPEMNVSTKDIKHITADQFDSEVTQSKLPVVAEFYATWCGPCKMLAPILDKKAESLSGRVKFVKINIDESPGLAQRYSVEAIPTILFFRDGKVIDSLTGLPSGNALETRLRALEK